MNIFSYKPVTPGFRNKSFVYNSLYKGKLNNKFLKKVKYCAGRNNLGRITVRHKGGRVKRRYRSLDFSRIKFFNAKIVRIEYDPYRNCNIAFICYFNGEKSYIIAPKNSKINDLIYSYNIHFFKPGSSMFLKDIPDGSKIHCVEDYPLSGFKYSRSAGVFSILISKTSKYVNVLLKSGVVKKFHLYCKALMGEVGNNNYNLIKKGKASINRFKGYRPTVRGVAMNPVDHPHGGGEGKTSGGRDPVSPWGIPTKGYKTVK